MIPDDGPVTDLSDAAAEPGAPRAGTMAAAFAALDWSATPLGPPARWPHSLRTLVDLMLAARQPVCVGWGPDCLSLYNDECLALLGTRRPQGLARPFRETWPEFWDEHRTIVDAALRGEAKAFVDRPFASPGRPGRPVSWFTFTVTPVRDESGAVAGVFCAATETTDEVLARDGMRASEARQAFLLDLSDALRPLPDALAIMRTATRMLGERMRADVVLYGEVSEDGRRIVVPESYARGPLPAMKGAFPTDAFTEADLAALREGRTAVVSNAAGPTGEAESADGTSPAISGVVVPLVKGGRWVAQLGVRHGSPQAWTPDEILLLEQAAERTWEAVERARAEAALRDSEERYRSALRVSRIGSWTAEPKAGVRRWTPEAMALFGFDRPGGVGVIGDAPGQGDEWLDALHPDDRDLPARLRRAFQTQDRLPVEYRIVRPDGSVAWISGHGEVMERDAAGAPTRLVNVAADVTEARLAVEALRASEERFRGLAEAAPLLVWRSEDGNATWFNPRWRDYTGLPEGGGLGETWTAVVHPDDLPTALERSAEALRTGRPYEIEYRLRARDGSYRWHIARAVRIADGRTWIGCATDIDDLKRADDAQRASEERFRSFAENSADALWIVDAETGRLEYLSPAFERMWGETRDRVMSDLGRWAELLHPDDRERASLGMRRLLAGETYQQEYRIVRPGDGAVRWIQDTGFPIRDGAGRMVRVGGIAQDVTERKEAEAELRRSRRRSRALVEGIPQLVWRAVDGGEWTWSSPQWRAFTGLSEQASRGFGWLDALHPDDRETAMSAWRAALAESGLEVEYRLFNQAEGRHRWVQTRAEPTRDEDGAVVEWLGTSTDIHDLRTLQERQKLLLAELQHRVRNTLSVVRSIARRTAQTSDTVEDYAMHLDGRLNAFARTQAAVTRDPSAGVSLDYLVAEELVAYGVREADATAGPVHIDGPPVRLTVKAAETLGLAIHELATNAVKYGALAPGVSDGRLAVKWDFREGEAGRELLLAWTEKRKNGPAVDGPRRRGFGTELLQRTLKFELKARTTLDHGPTGFRCTIALPVTDRVVLPTDAAAEA